MAGSRWLIHSISLFSCVLMVGMDNGLAISAIRLPDGSTWSATGRFRLEFTLRNNSAQPIAIWDPANSEGSLSPSVVLTGGHGNKWTLSPHGIERSGIPTAVTLEPTGTLTITLNLPEMTKSSSIDPGDYKVQVSYRNSQPATGPVKKIWIGEITSEFVNLHIARRAAARK
jgi:hypothetical protein